MQNALSKKDAEIARIRAEEGRAEMQRRMEMMEKVYEAKLDAIRTETREDIKENKDGIFTRVGKEIGKSVDFVLNPIKSLFGLFLGYIFVCPNYAGSARRKKLISLLCNKPLYSFCKSGRLG